MDVWEGGCLALAHAHPTHTLLTRGVAGAGATAATAAPPTHLGDPGVGVRVDDIAVAAAEREDVTAGQDVVKRVVDLAHAGKRARGRRAVLGFVVGPNGEGFWAEWGRVLGRLGRRVSGGVWVQRRFARCGRWPLHPFFPAPGRTHNTGQSVQSWVSHSTHAHGKRCEPGVNCTVQYSSSKALRGEITRPRAGTWQKTRSHATHSGLPHPQLAILTCFASSRYCAFMRNMVVSCREGGRWAHSVGAQATLTRSSGCAWEGLAPCGGRAVPCAPTKATRHRSQGRRMPTRARAHWTRQEPPPLPGAWARAWRASLQILQRNSLARNDDTARQAEGCACQVLVVWPLAAGSPLPPQALNPTLSAWS